MINRLYDAMEERKESSVLRNIFEGLLEYTKTHFSDEEKLQEKSNYPDYNLHKAPHERLTKNTLNLFAQFNNRAGEADIAFDLFKLLKGWWVGHINSVLQTCKILFFWQTFFNRKARQVGAENANL